MTTKDLQHLISQIERFESGNRAFTLSAFAHWLIAKDDRNDATKSGHNQNLPKHLSFTSLGAERKIGVLVNRLSRFSRYYVRKAFADLPINSYEEFTYLSAVDRLENPNKSDLNAANLMEPTSGNEIIRRLKALQLIKEVDDQHDKRVWRIRLSEKGKKIHREALKRLGTVSVEFSGTLSKKDKSDLLRLLIPLEEHHRRKWNAPKD